MAQVGSAFAAAFYNVPSKAGAGVPRGARITRQLRGAVHVLHGTNASMCATLNAGGRAPRGGSPRQVLATKPARCSSAPCGVETRVLASRAECGRALGGASGAPCPFGAEEGAPQEGSTVLGETAVFAATMESLRHYQKKSGGRACAELCI